ncbi:hypothetical protein SY83_10185 [Paenibacillus swuensis]|uniref:VOC domain-containing protein n=2 Tax=Paenibacillus swuensis TaxID=1178515 RepID=A0A172TP61_9BACL|nr:hypothetical protein SY83_10185 [Paenibacillus swuensis]
MTNQILIQGIGQVSVPVRNLEASLGFYRDVLGLPVLMAQHNMAILDCGGIHLLLSLPENEEHEGAGSTLYFNVSDIQASFEGLRSQDVSVVGAPHKVGDLGSVEVWLAFFKDPDGNLQALRGEVVKG